MLFAKDVLEIERWIADAAAGNVPLQPGESTAWTGFYAAYREADAEVRAKVDTAFRQLRASPDVAVREAVVSHWYEADRPVGFAELLDLLKHHGDLYGSQVEFGSTQTLRARLLGGLAAQATGDAAREILLKHVADVAVVPRRIGGYLGHLGAEATDALVRLRPDTGAAQAVKEAGYELHRRPDSWADALARAAGWPPALRTALLEGAEDHRSVFGRP